MSCLHPQNHEQNKRETKQPNPTELNKNKTEQKRQNTTNKMNRTKNNLTKQKAYDV